MSITAQKNIMEAVELEAILSLSNAEVKSSVLPRWERKLLSSSSSSASCSANNAACNIPSSPMKKASSSSMPKTPSNAGSSTNGAKTPSSALRQQQTNINKPKALAAKTPQGADRLIASRSATDFAMASYNIAKLAGSSSSSEVPASPSLVATATTSSSEFQKTLSEAMGAATAGGDSRILAFRKKAPLPKNISEGDYENCLGVLYQQKNRKTSVLTASAAGSVTAPTRYIPSAPEKILDAPDLMNDFYINPLDWSSSGQLGVALGSTVYLWSAATGSINELCSLEGPSDYVSSVKFVQEGGGYVALGASNKTIALWDVESQKKLRTLGGHEARISSLAWNQHVLTSGGRDSQIIQHDVRVPNHIVGRMANGHSQEVCSLQWSLDGQSLASGSNDNSVCVWDARFLEGPRLRLLDHLAAVKALAWCPYQRNTLATGGGTSDRSIKIWNTVSGAMEQSVDTGSQVCSLLFNPHSKELLSSHGFTENQLTLWKFPTMSKIKDLTGHTARVLHTTVSPDGLTVCSAGADETIRFWKVFGGSMAKKAEVGAKAASGGVLKMNIR